MKYIFVAGAPGSKWSSVCKNIYFSGDIDTSDYMELKIQAKEMEIAGKEMSYSEGYAEGYKRALDYISMSIENAKALISTEII